MNNQNLGLREKNGFDPHEFSDLEFIEVNGSIKRSLKELNERESWHQLFGTYQEKSNIQAALHAAIEKGLRVGIGSEAPCNMFAPGPKRLAKTLYLRTILKRRVKTAQQYGDFIINWSGDDKGALMKLGWRAEKIIPFGYFPPPLPNSAFIPRKERHHSDFHILCSGDMTWHRGPDILMNALVLLKDLGLNVRTTFTSNGPLLSSLQNRAKAHHLNCTFPGFVSMEELVTLYESCSIFVAPGRAEPWGMRVNDALQCGAPVVISDGMGAAKLVDDYGLGVRFHRDDPLALAVKIYELITDRDLYQKISYNLAKNRDALTPNGAAQRLLNLLASQGSGWFS